VSPQADVKKKEKKEFLVQIRMDSGVLRVARGSSGAKTPPRAPERAKTYHAKHTLEGSSFWPYGNDERLN